MIYNKLMDVNWVDARSGASDRLEWTGVIPAGNGGHRWVGGLVV